MDNPITMTGSIHVSVLVSLSCNFLFTSHISALTREISHCVQTGAMQISIYGLVHFRAFASLKIGFSESIDLFCAG